MVTGYGAIDKLSLTGGDMTGDVNLPGTPATQAGAVPKSYVDSGFLGAVAQSGDSYPERSPTVVVNVWVGTLPPPDSAPICR